MSKTVWQYYIDTSKRILEDALKGVDSLDDWLSSRETLRRRFLRSVGLDSMPAKTDLGITWHGRLQGEGFRAEKVSYQILPDCLGTGIVFYPDPLPAEKAPGILYCCGHAKIGVLNYAGHGVMWARRGYVCLVIDTIQQHDNPGLHQGIGGKYRYDWVSMGYPGCCGEIWNSIRALDFLSGLPEVDALRIGATGTSGGGSLSFLTSVADERIAAVATACGVTTPYYTLANRHMMRHCDCMYVQNVFQHDTSEFGALLAPRPALFSYGDDDALFSNDEYRGMVGKIKPVYELYGCPENCELFEYHGPHGYVPESIDRINRWFDAHLAGEERPLLQPSHPFSERDITIFNGAPPVPNRTNLLPELLSPVGSVPLPKTSDEWPAIRERAVARLRTEVFPCLDAETMTIETVGNWTCGPDGRFISYRANLGGVELWMEHRSRDSDTVVLGVANPRQNHMSVIHKMADFLEDRTAFFLEPRGCGTTSTNTTDLSVDRDNFLLQAGTMVGMTPLMLVIQDLRHIVRFIVEQPHIVGKRLFLYGSGDAAAACLYHAVMDENVAGVVLEKLPMTHRRGCYITGILRVLDIEQACGLLAPRPVALVDREPSRNVWVTRLYERLGCPENFVEKCQSAACAMNDVIRLNSESG